VEPGHPFKLAHVVHDGPSEQDVGGVLDSAGGEMAIEQKI
jgi:hypothetical protein